MSEYWHSCIASELRSVEELMENTLCSENDELTEMCHYIAGSGGKRLRPAMCILSYYACGGTESEKPVMIGSGFEIIHSATLVHDDINDQGEFRRGRKTLHREYSVSRAIITGDYMFAMGFKLLAEAAPHLVNFIVEASAAMGAGEFIQKDFEHRPDVGVDDYIEIITGKTAKFFEASAQSGAAIAGADPATLGSLGEYALNMGISFQIVDDTLDVTGDPKKTGKTVGTDLLEGKPTLPVIYAMKDPDVGDEIRELFRRIEPSFEDVARALELIQKTDAVAECMSLAEEYSDKAIACLESVPDSVYRQSLMDVAKYTVRRER